MQRKRNPEGRDMITTPAIPTRRHLDKLFDRIDPVRGRLIFALDATASRRPTWDAAAQLTTQMFGTVAAIGGLDVQLVYYRGSTECIASRWLSDAKALSAAMQRVMCMAGYTQINRVLAHARKENAREKVSALILISDACEEDPPSLYVEAHELGVPVFLFQEGAHARVRRIYSELARVTGGAHCEFDAGAEQRLADLLKVVAAFAAGGVKALANQNTEAAKLLLTQVKP
jgi:hypothetical protein